MAYWLSDGHVTAMTSRDNERSNSWDRDPNMLGAQNLENSWRCYSLFSNNNR